MVHAIYYLSLLLGVERNILQAHTSNLFCAREILSKVTVQEKKLSEGEGNLKLCKAFGVILERKYSPEVKEKRRQKTKGFLTYMQ